MNCFNLDVRERILNADNLGAGNILNIVFNLSSNKDRDFIFLQTPYIAINGKAFSQFSLTSLMSVSSQWAKHYRSLGITQKDVVGIYLDDSIEYFIHFLALTRIGAIPALVNSRLDPSITNQYLKNVSVVALTGSRKRIQAIGTLEGSLNNELIEVCTDEMSYTAVHSEDIEPLHYQHSETDPILLTHTSGTTGVPKAVIAAHKAFLHGILYRVKYPLEHCDRFLTALPHSHNSGIAYLLEACIRGCDVFVQCDKSPKSMSKSIREFQPNLVVAFPKIFVDMYRQVVPSEDLRSVFYWRSTGDAAHERHVKYITRWGSHMEQGKLAPGSVYIDGLGSSEMGSSLFVVHHTQEKRNYNRCVGRAQPWVTAAVLDNNGAELPPGKVGKLGVKSPSLTAGYWNNHSLTEKFRSAGYWLTGDLAYRDAFNNYYHVDRITDVIETQAGPVFSLLTEEYVLKQFEECVDCSVYATHSELDSQCQANICVTLSDTDSRNFDSENLLLRINTFLIENNLLPLNAISRAASHMPIPEGITGKILKRKLRVKTEAEPA